MGADAQKRPVGKLGKKNKGAVAQLMESIDRSDSPFICGASENALKVSLTARFFLLEA